MPACGGISLSESGSFSRFPIAAMPLYRSSALWDFDRLRYVGSLLPHRLRYVGL